MLSIVFCFFFPGKTLQQLIVAVTVSMKAPGLLTDVHNAAVLCFVEASECVCMYVSVTFILV